jgi:hypothetical protein
LEGKVASYRKARVAEFMGRHGKYFQSINGNARLKESLKKCVSHMALGLIPPPDIGGMDRQLFDITVDGNGRDIIAAINPIAREALLTSNCAEVLSSLEEVARMVLKDELYENDMKGRVIERYLTTHMELQMAFTFKATSGRKTRSRNSTSKEVTVKFAKVIRFSGSKLPPQYSFYRAHSTLFVPVSPKYPAFDFFIWDAKQKRLLGFQVTVRQPYTEHRPMDGEDTEENRENWQRLCFGDSGTKQAMSLYWIIPKDSLPTNSPVEMKGAIILFDALYGTFPVLAQFVRFKISESLPSVDGIHA